MTVKLRSLLHASQEGDVVQVRSILQAGHLAVNAADENGTTALQVAAANDQMDVLEVLVGFGANVNQANSVGWTPLHQACCHGHTNVVRFLLEHGADSSLRNKYGAGPLCMGAASGHISTVRLLLETGLKAEDSQSLPPQFKTCPTPALTAAMYGRESVLRTLLNRGAKPDCPSLPSRWTPLMFAAAVGSKPSCQILMERSADPNKQNLLGATALDIAMATGNSVVRVYLEGKTALQPKNILGDENRELNLLEAAKQGDLERVKELLGKEETNVDMMDQDGATPLILAAIGGFLTITRLLINLGANLNHQDRINGWTALMQATFYGHKAVAQVLLEAKADPTIAAFNGCTALDLATLVDVKDSELVRQLALRTIQIEPPGLVLTPTRRPPVTPRLAFQSKALSTGNLFDKQEEEEERDNEGAEHSNSPNVLKSWWNRFSNRFKKSEERGEETPSHLAAPASNPVDSQFSSIVPQTSVFTLGFTPPSAAAATAAAEPAVSSPPHFHHTLHNTSASPGKLFMPTGKEVMKKAPLVILKTKRLLSQTDSANSSPAASLGLNKKQVEKHRQKKKIHSGKSERRSRSVVVKSVQEVLKELDLLQYYPLLVEQEIDMAALRHVTPEDLIELGIPSKRDRAKLINYVKMLPA